MIIPYSVRRTLAPVCIAAFFAVQFAFSATATAADWKFDVKFTEAVRKEPFTGRVFLAFSRGFRDPRFQLQFFNFHPELILVKEMKNWKPGETATFSADKPEKMVAYPKSLAEMDLKGYRVQALVRFNPHDRKISTGVGNGYSQVVAIESFSPAGEPPLLIIDKRVDSKKFHETRWNKLLRIRSNLLSDFHKRDVFMNASVLLPESYYDNPTRSYPAIFTIPGFGGTHIVRRDKPIQENNKQGVEFLRVLLDPSCPLGHHVFADSANNGPQGRALITELIPAFNKLFRSIPQPSARFLTGHSSGGWSSLWLQVTYPEFFGGTWSTAPDPVDFRDFQRINLYNPGENMYVDAQGNQRPIARSQGRVLVWYKDFDSFEWTLGPGGQLHSFEASFSPRGDDGKPMLAWDRKTGVVNTTVARTWEKYDIRLILERNWKTLGPKLKGKLHVFMGDNDTFYLEGATILLKKTMAKLNTDAVVEIHPGKDHGSLMTRELRDRIRREMVEAFLKKHPQR
ncbi:MAG: hypothetical protein IID46_00175 [Planctomycetes bacterium]|nr:hypothetical protein [Planctomycetota bacterium]